MSLIGWAITGSGFALLIVGGAIRSAAQGTRFFVHHEAAVVTYAIIYPLALVLGMLFGFVFGLVGQRFGTTLGMKSKRMSRLGPNQIGYAFAILAGVIAGLITLGMWAADFGL